MRDAALGYAAVVYAGGGLLPVLMQSLSGISFHA
jgi:hypothetical protein